MWWSEENFDKCDLLVHFSGLFVAPWEKKQVYRKHLAMEIKITLDSLGSFLRGTPVVNGTGLEQSKLPVSLQRSVQSLQSPGQIRSNSRHASPPVCRRRFKMSTQSSEHSTSADGSSSLWMSGDSAVCLSVPLRLSSLCLEQWRTTWCVVNSC